MSTAGRDDAVRVALEAQDAIDGLLNAVHGRLGGANVTIVSCGGGTIRVEWWRFYPGAGLSDARTLEAMSLTAGLVGVLEYEDEADLIDAAEDTR